MAKKEYIERDRLYELGYWHGATPTLDNPSPDGVDAVDTKDIDSIPAADVRPVVRGKWIQTTQPMGWRDEDCAECSVCGEDFVLGEWAMDEFTNLMNFCPNCGADMRPEPPKEE